MPRRAAELAVFGASKLFLERYENTTFAFSIRHQVSCPASDFHNYICRLSSNVALSLALLSSDPVYKYSMAHSYASYGTAAFYLL
jgi:hypothetical protein